MDAINKTYRIKVVREPGNDPITGTFYERAEQEFDVEAPTPLAAFIRSQIKDTIIFRGQLRRTFINGEEYFDERY